MIFDKKSWYWTSTVENTQNTDQPPSCEIAELKTLASMVVTQANSNFKPWYSNTSQAIGQPANVSSLLNSSTVCRAMVPIAFYVNDNDVGNQVKTLLEKALLNVHDKKDIVVEYNNNDGIIITMGGSEFPAQELLNLIQDINDTDNEDQKLTQKENILKKLKEMDL